jgi:hypothetical protein
LDRICGNHPCDRTKLFHYQTQYREEYGKVESKQSL